MLVVGTLGRSDGGRLAEELGDGFLACCVLFGHRAVMDAQFGAKLQEHQSLMTATSDLAGVSGEESRCEHVQARACRFDDKRKLNFLTVFPGPIRAASSPWSSHNQQSTCHATVRGTPSIFAVAPSHVC